MLRPDQAVYLSIQSAVSRNLALTIFDKQISLHLTSGLISGHLKHILDGLPLLVQYGDDKVELLSVSFEDQLKVQTHSSSETLLSHVFLHELVLIFTVKCAQGSFQAQLKAETQCLGVWG